jgi:hypothetical protein
MASSISKTILTSLTTAALALPGIAQAEVKSHENKNIPQANQTGVPKDKANAAKSWFEGVTADAKYTRYSEEGPRYDINVWQAHFVVPAKDFRYTLDLQRDDQTGGSQKYLAPASQVNPGANPTQLVGVRTGATIKEDRSELKFKTEYFAQDAVYNIALYYSNEQDLVSPGISALGQWNFNKNNTILSAGAGVAYEDSKPTQDGVFREIPQPRPKGHSTIQKYFISLRQDLSKYNYVQLSNEFQYSHGNLDDPYVAAGAYGNASAFIRRTGDGFFFPPFFTGPGYPDGFTALGEKRPSHRSIWMPLIRFVQYVPGTDGAAHFDYRFGADDWHLRSHTFELKYFQPLGSGWQVAPLVRYYSQSSVDFYGPIYNLNSPGSVGPSVPFTTKGWTPDYRLSAYGTLNFELKVSYQVLSFMNAGLTAGYYKLKPNWSLSKKNAIINPALPAKGYGAQYFSIDLRFKL